MRRPATDPIGRVAAAVMVACGIVHGAAAVEHLAMSPVLSGLTILVALACLHCVGGLWRRPGPPLPHRPLRSRPGLPGRLCL